MNGFISYFYEGTPSCQ